MSGGLTNGFSGLWDGDVGLYGGNPGLYSGASGLAKPSGNAESDPSLDFSQEFNSQYFFLLFLW